MKREMTCCTGESDMPSRTQRNKTRMLSLFFWLFVSRNHRIRRYSNTQQYFHECLLFSFVNFGASISIEAIEIVSSARNMGMRKIWNSFDSRISSNCAATEASSDHFALKVTILSIFYFKSSLLRLYKEWCRYTNFWITLLHSRFLEASSD